MCKFTNYSEILYMQGYHSYKTGILKVTGKDKLDYFNRISTNKFTSFPDMTYIKTLFLNDKGRIIDFCTILNCDDSFYVICTPGNADKLEAHIEKYTVTEDIHVKMYTGLISYFTGSEFSLKDIKTGTNNVKRRNNSFIISDVYRFPKTIVIEMGNQDYQLTQKLSANKVKISDNDFAIFCMKHFHLYSQKELNDNVNPLECYLENYISFNKGCYIGQEIISRIHSQGKIAKCLINIESKHRFSDGDLIYTERDHHDTECGYVTTAVENKGEYLGFGYIRTKVLRNNNIYRINRNEIFINYKQN